MTERNPEIEQLYASYLEISQSQAAAASLVVATVLLQREVKPPAEPNDQANDPTSGQLFNRSYTVKEAAEYLHLSSKKVYQMCLDNELRCFRAGRAVRIPVEEIERFQKATPPSAPGFAVHDHLS